MLRKRERAGYAARRPHIHAPMSKGAGTILLAKNWDGKSFYHHNFNGLSFVDCNLSECLFYACRFENCYFEDVCFAKSVFIDCVFLGCSGSQLDFDHSIYQNAKFCNTSYQLFSTYGLIKMGSAGIEPSDSHHAKNVDKHDVYKDISMSHCSIFPAKNSLYYNSQIQPKIKTYFAKIKGNSIVSSHGEG